MILRLAVVSDIHGNLPALQAVLAHLERSGGADLVLNLGDILSGPLWPRETAAFLMAQGWPTIAGNHERQLLACARTPGAACDQFAFEQTTPEQRAWLAALPQQLQPHPTVRMVHGSPRSDCEYWLETVVPQQGARAATAAEVAERAGAVAERVVLCGHTHMPRSAMLASGALVVNPGSVGLPAYTDEDGGYHAIETGSPHARYATLDLSAHGVDVNVHAVAYDWAASSARAEQNGALDWARWLNSGRASA
jgi:predicted phosphodiesterase